MDYPPNSKMKPPAPSDKNIERVTTAEVKRKKKSLGKQFRETFVMGDAKTAMHYVVFNTLIPAAKDTMMDSVNQWLERIIFGETRSRRGSRSPLPPQHGYTNYQSIGAAARPQPGRTMSNRARARHDFDEIVLESRSEAEDVLERLCDIVSQYGSASVADLYLLTGLASNHTDESWGWTTMQGANISRFRGAGYLLNLPEPTPLR